jgi:preprotein translocase subunit SecF
MKKVINFSKFFFPSAILSIIIAAFGITGYFLKGFTLGVDFQAGLLQEVRFAPTALSMRWSGTGNAVLNFDRNNVYIITSGMGVESRTHTFSLNEFRTISSLAQAMTQQLEDLDVTVQTRADVNSSWLFFSSHANPNLGESPYVVHYLNPQNSPIDIADVRSAMTDIGVGFSVQSLGSPSDRHFMIRVEDKEEGRVRSDQVVSILESHFGFGGVAVLRSDYVGSRFSKDLTDQAGMLLAMTLLLVLIYSAIRFKLQYAVGAVIAIMYDGLVMVAFVVWTQMEFTTTTIAALMTILGYSTNNTIIFFDRMRENMRIYPDHSFVDLLNISLTGILGRTIITTATTMLAVLALFIFTTGSMKDFALALMVGMVSGVYTTLFIVTGVVNFWENQKIKRAKKKLVTA